MMKNPKVRSGREAQEKPSSGLSRRSFLKKAVATGALALTTPLRGLLDAAPPASRAEAVPDNGATARDAFSRIPAIDRSDSFDVCHRIWNGEAFTTGRTS